MRLLMILAFLALNVSMAWSQKVPKNPMKWGKIPEADLKMTSYDLDPEAEAVVLGEYGNMEYFVSTSGYIKYKYKVHVRIKILKESAIKEYSNFEEGYMPNNNIRLLGLKAQSFTSKGVKQTASSKNIFVDKKTKDYYVKKVTIPNVQVGSVLEYKYTIESFAATRIPTWYFQQSIPVRISRFNARVITGLQFVYHLNGEQYLKSLGNDTYTYQGTSKLTIVDRRNYTMENVQAVKKEKYLTTLKDHMASISFYLESSDLAGGKKTYLGDWDNFAKRRRESKNLGEQYTSKKNYIEIVKAASPIFNNKEFGEKEKVEAFYNFINEEMKWNEYYSSFSYGLNDAFKEKKGTSGELNLMLLCLLREAKIEAYPVFISTRGHGKALETYPLADQFNHIMVYAKVEGEDVFLDTKNEFRPIGYPSISSLNKRGWILRDKGYEWIDIPAKKGSNVFLVNAELKEDGALEGVLKGAYEGYNAASRRYYCKEKKSKERWKKNLTKKYPEIKIDSMLFKDLKKLSKPFKDEIYWKIPEAAQVAGDLIYISPAFYSAFSENNLKQEKRLYPVDFPNPFKEQLIVNLKIPEGYVVDELPEAVNLALPNKGGRFQYFVKEKNGMVQIVSKILINQLLFEPSEYSGLKKLFDLVVEKHGEQLVLKKAN